MTERVKDLKNSQEFVSQQLCIIQNIYEICWMKEISTMMLTPRFGVTNCRISFRVVKVPLNSMKSIQENIKCH
jgi:hypothetical protein